MPAPNTAFTIPEPFLAICQEELRRSSLTSLPLKLEFMRERGLPDLDAVNDWMRRTRQAFESAIKTQAGENDERSDKRARHVAFLTELANDPVLAEDLFAHCPELKDKLRRFLFGPTALVSKKDPGFYISYQHGEWKIRPGYEGVPDDPAYRWEGVHIGASPDQHALALLERCRDFIDQTLAPSYPAGVELADEIDAVLREHGIESTPANHIMPRVR